MEWEAPAIVLSASPYGESSVIAHVLTEAHGAYRGLVRGGSARANLALWQPGNLVTAHWFARLPEQLGALRAELVHPTAARLLSLPLALALVAACCALADDALPEREPHADLFHATVRMLTALGTDPGRASLSGPAQFVRWEALLLAELGYGLDLSCCAVTGATANLLFVSPRTGRAVSDEAAAEWRDRLLPMPRLLRDGDMDGDPADWAAALRTTGHFLARDVFGHRHRPVPAARLRLADMIERLSGEQDRAVGPSQGDQREQT